MPTISYAITACNEYEELKRLIEQILLHKRSEDEIVVQVDQDRVTEEVLGVLRAYSADVANVIKFPLNKDFATFKNNIKSYCKKDYIFFVDADEYLSKNLIDSLPEILNENSQVDMFSVPRSNTVEGITEHHIKQWRWVLDSQGRVNWPDYQNRIIKNLPNIQWINRVHERIEGYKTTCLFPNNDEDWCLYHPKTIEKQENQNSFYNSI